MNDGYERAAQRQYDAMEAPEAEPADFVERSMGEMYLALNLLESASSHLDDSGIEWLSGDCDKVVIGLSELIWDCKRVVKDG